MSPTLAALVFLLSTVAPPPTPGLPKDVHALSPALALKMDALVRAAEGYRGLRLKRPVPYGALDEKGLRTKVMETLDEDLPPEEMRAFEASLKAFGLLPAGADAGKIYRDLLVQQVAAFYDPERKYLAMIERTDGGDAMPKGTSPELARRAREGVLVHELTHAIDDQSFDIAKMSKTDPLSDESSAILGLVEGDATVVMYDFVLGKRVEEVPGFARELRKTMEDPKQLASLSADLPGGGGLAQAPAWFRDSLIFSYLQGFTFCLDLERRGGQKLLDYAFAKDPPRSTEQLLHPEKWYGRRDDPIGLPWPDLSALLPGWKKAAEGQMGEEGIGILLREAVPGPMTAATVAAAASAAAGWGGDRFGVYEQGGVKGQEVAKDGKRLLLWVTEWDTAADAAEFQAAAARLPTVEGWHVARSSPTRVVLTRGPGGSLGPEPRAKIEAALAAIQPQRPANKDIDLAALGIGAAPAAPIPPARVPSDGQGEPHRGGWR
jgi:hypothetical protein